jgi:hypothetical protein
VPTLGSAGRAKPWVRALIHLAGQAGVMATTTGGSDPIDSRKMRYSTRQLFLTLSAARPIPGATRDAMHIDPQ